MKLSFITCVFIVSIFADNVFKKYGFNDNQIEALESLFKAEGILEKEVNFDEKFEEERVKENVRELILLIKNIQDKFTKRFDEKKLERFEVEGTVRDNVEWYIEIFRTLGFVDEILDDISNEDIVCVLGATVPSMKLRLEFTKSVLKWNNLMMLLVGERPLKESGDGDLRRIAGAMRKDIAEQDLMLTETDGMIYAFSEVFGIGSDYLIQRERDLIAASSWNNLAVLLDTKKDENSRPTTKSTVEHLIEFLRKNRLNNRLVFVSAQPYAKYQGVVTEYKISDAKLSMRIIGNGVNLDAIRESKNVHRLMDGLSAFLWAKTPQVISEIHVDRCDENTCDLIKDMYEKSGLWGYVALNLKRVERDLLPDLMRVAA